MHHQRFLRNSIWSRNKNRNPFDNCKHAMWRFSESRYVGVWHSIVWLWPKCTIRKKRTKLRWTWQRNAPFSTKTKHLPSTSSSLSQLHDQHRSIAFALPYPRLFRTTDAYIYERETWQAHARAHLRMITDTQALVYRMIIWCGSCYCVEIMCVRFGCRCCLLLLFVWTFAFYCVYAFA